MDIDLTKDEIQTILIILDIDKRTGNCSGCGNRSYCDSAWAKLAKANNQLQGVKYHGTENS